MSNLQQGNSNQRLMAILSYLGILFLIPMLSSEKNDPFVKFHLNQGIVLFIIGAIVSFAAAIPFIGWLVGLAGGAFCLVMCILGVIAAYNMQTKPLPILSQFTILN